VPGASFVRGDGLHPPFEPGSFERVHAGHFYGHLTEEQRSAFLGVARELAGELVITDSALRPDRGPEAWDERVLDDGSRHRVYKRWFTAAGLAEELGGGETVHDGPWFVSVRLSLRS
jgi:demethylmenaquinone methyltransferase/2-methoxy-6-polyprenyl-1,4-benzoquinol methylase